MGGPDLVSAGQGSNYGSKYMRKILAVSGVYIKEALMLILE